MPPRLRGAVVAGAVLVLAGDRAAGPAPAAAAAASPAPTVAVDTVVVEATDRLVFQPDSVVIHVGDVVTWRNAGVVRHSVTADPDVATLDDSVRLPDGAEPFDSGLLAEGTTFSHTFRVPGRYDYFCSPHEGAGMGGTVFVVDGADRGVRAPDFRPRETTGRSGSARPR